MNNNDKKLMEVSNNNLDKDWRLDISKKRLKDSWSFLKIFKKRKKSVEVPDYRNYILP